MATGLHGRGYLAAKFMGHCKGQSALVVKLDNDLWFLTIKNFENKIAHKIVVRSAGV